jgi:site-specific DNA-methyltransferase (adenine-specific)
MRKVQEKNEKSILEIMSANDPFGYDVRVENSYLRVKPNYKLVPFKNSLKFYYYGWRDKGIGYISPETVRKGFDYVNSYKVFIPRAWGTGNTNTDRLNAFIGEPNTVCTETYSVIAPLKSEIEAKNVLSYINTKFFHFLVSIIKITQAAAKHVYRLVPMQDFNEEWTDEKLYEKYGLTEDEIAFIESMIRPME